MLSRLAGRKLLGATASLQKTVKCNSSRGICSSLNIHVGKNSVFHSHKYAKVYGAFAFRYQSTTSEDASLTWLQDSAKQAQSVTSATENNTLSSAVDTAAPQKSYISDIPDAPTPIGEQIVETLKVHENGEVCFSSIGLGGWGPVGLIQNYFEWLHITFDMPWFTAIVLTSLAVKILTIPLTVSALKANAKMQNFMPKIVELQENITEARRNGDVNETTIYSIQLRSLLKENNIKTFPLSNLGRIFIHIPIFMGLREMANAPVESLKTGGILWFTDLTVADPYYLLPIFTSVTLYLVTEFTMVSNKAMQVNPTVRKLIRALPFVSFLFSMHFPGAALIHWVVSNITTTIQNEIFKIKTVKNFFNIPQIEIHEVKTKKKTYSSFSEAFYESWSNIKMTQKVARNEYDDNQQFNLAAKAPLKKTFKYDPLKALPSNKSAISAKSAMKK